jgi:hypothetical protein
VGLAETLEKSFQIPESISFLEVFQHISCFMGICGHLLLHGNYRTMNLSPELSPASWVSVGICCFMGIDRTMNLSPELTVGSCCFMDMDHGNLSPELIVPWLISAARAKTKTIAAITKANTLAMKTFEQNRQKRKTYK